MTRALAIVALMAVLMGCALVGQVPSRVCVENLDPAHCGGP